jgi:polysaccharide deacetylase family protein (PEP-CTERM system associated)
VEDWFQVENFKPYIPFSSWPERELRVERNVHRLLDLFDETKNNTHAVKPRATFFILGWLAERIPNLVREIQDRGHEVASHGCNHQLPDQLSAVELKQDLTDSKKLLEDITGAEVVGYRAPSFSINDDILKTLQDCGYRYDSSYNSFSLHGRYGKISLNGISKKGFAHKLSDNFYELPVSNLMINGRVLPWGGGGYFRLTPYRLFRLGVKTILKKDETYVFYIHPWEIDPNQPRVKNASSGYIFRHYVNLGKTQYKLINLIDNFSKCHFITCNQYLDELV